MRTAAPTSRRTSSPARAARTRSASPWPCAPTWRHSRRGPGVRGASCRWAWGSRPRRGAVLSREGAAPPGQRGRRAFGAARRRFVLQRSQRLGARPRRQRREPDATLVATLLLVAQLAAPAAVSNRALARRQWEAAQEREAVLDLDGALALYRAARAADPSYLPSQYDYFQLMRASGSVQQLRRELAWPGPRGGPLTLCLAQVTRLRRDDVSGGRRLWALIEAGREGCPLSVGVLFLGQWVFTVDLESRFLASGARLVRDAPAAWRLWQFYCNGLVRAGRTREVA